MLHAEQGDFTGQDCGLLLERRSPWTSKKLCKRNTDKRRLRVADGNKTDCCGAGSCCGPESWDPITSNLYDEQQAAGVPAEAMLASLGCGNPTALADLKPGETVLDLGSGGGIDVLLSAEARRTDWQSLRARHDR